jgi:hypothetical protein
VILGFSEWYAFNFRNILFYSLLKCLLVTKFFLQGTRSLQRVKYIIKELYKRGIKRLCKVLLKSHRDDAVDTD